MKYKIALADAFRFKEMDYSLERELLQDYNAELHIFNCHTEEELVENLKNFHIILLVAAPFTEKVINNLDNCSALIRYGVGLDSIDISAATRKNIMVCNDPDYCIEDVALHTTTLLLNLTRKISLLDKEVRRGNWDFQSGYPAHRLLNKVIGFVGFGDIPKKVMEYLQPYGLKYIVYDPYLSKQEAEKYGVILLSNLDELLMTANYISIHCPLTADTKNLISFNEFELMQNDTFIINTSRGPIINHAALIDALTHKKIRGAGLDVFEHEPLSSDDPICSFDNVILTPHAAFYTKEAFKQLRVSVIQQAISVIEGNKPDYIVNQI